MRLCLPPLLACALLCPAAAFAQAVALTGILGSKALLVVDGTPPRGVAPGDSHQGVKVVSVGRDDAVVDFGGMRRTVRLGEAPVSVGARGGSGGASCSRPTAAGISSTRARSTAR